jgi:esterase
MGAGPPLILLHGLFGSSDNLKTVARALSTQHKVYSFDLRNHGLSSHAPDISYPLIAADIRETMQELGVERAAVMGHSMGGKAAMQLAMNHPAMVSQLCVADIAPVMYPPHHRNVLAGLTAILKTTISSRRQANALLADYVEDAATRGFLLKSLARVDEQGYAWRFNVAAIEACYDAIAAAPVGPTFTGPTLFIKGGESDYIKTAHSEAILELFPAATFKVIAAAGHWLHAEKPVAFNRLLGRFLET